MKRIYTSLLALLIGFAAAAQTWVSITPCTMTNYYSCSFGDASTFYAVGHTGGLPDTTSIIKSTNGGISFSNIGASFLPANRVMRAVCFTSRDTGFICGGTHNLTSPPYRWSAGCIYKTTDGGTSWTLVVSGAAASLSFMQFSGSMVGYAAGSDGSTGVIYKTIDGGNTWAVIYTSSTSIGIYGLSVVDDTTAYVTGYDAGVSPWQAKLISIRGGVVATDVDIAAYSSFGGVYFVSRDTGFTSTCHYATTGGTNEMRETTDGGITWSNVHSMGISGAAQVKFVNRLVGYALVDSTYVTYDGGNTWLGTWPAPPYAGGPFWIDGRNNTAMIVGEGGLMLRNAAVTSVPEVHLPQLQVVVRPNPLVNVSCVSFEEEQVNTMITIIDMPGRSVKQTKLNGKELTIEKGDLKEGVYYLRATTESGNTRTIPFIIQ